MPLIKRNRMKMKPLHRICLSFLFAIVAASHARADVLITIDGSSSDVIVTESGT
jgi:hypothetical protein